MNQALGSPRQEDQFREFLSVLRRRKGIVVGGTVLCLLLGVVSILVTAPSYQVVARVLVNDYATQNVRPAASIVDRTTKISVPPEIGAQIGLMQSPAVLNDAFTRAGVTPPSAEATERILDIKQENTTPVVDIEVNLPDEQGSTRLAEAIPAAFNEYHRTQEAAQVKSTADQQRGRLADARTDLNNAQNKLEAYLGQQGKSGSVAASVSEGEVRTQRLGTLNQQLETARVELTGAQSALRESLVAQAKISKTIEDTNQRPSAEQIQSQKKVIADLTADLNAARVNYSEKAPEVRSLQVRLKEQQAYLDRIPTTTILTAKVRNPERAVYDQRVAEAQARVASAQSQVAQLEAALSTEQTALTAYQKRLPEQRALTNLVDEKKQAVTLAAQNLSEAEALASANQPALQVLTTTPPVKTNPVIGRTLVASTLLGIVFGMFAALLRDRFDNRIYTLEQIYDASGAVPIGEVPVTGRPLALEKGGNRSRTLESYRSLRYNLESSNATGAVQSVLVSSASAGEGRAGLSMNLATEAATDMRKTILVDADLRTPELHDRFKVARDPGLSDVLSGRVALADVLKETGQDNLLFLSSGTEHHNPLELLSGPSMLATHDALKGMADVIIFNSPSLMRYSDARALALVTDSAIFVAKRGFTRRDAMRYCVGMLRRAKASFLGVVLVDESGRSAKDVPYFATE